MQKLATVAISAMKSLMELVACPRLVIVLQVDFLDKFVISMGE